MPKWFNLSYFVVYLLAYTNSAINPIFIANLNKFYKIGLNFKFKLLNSFKIWCGEIFLFYPKEFIKFFKTFSTKNKNRQIETRFWHSWYSFNFANIPKSQFHLVIKICVPLVDKKRIRYSIGNYILSNK